MKKQLIFAASLLISASQFSMADDTEIFTGGGTGGNTNLLFVVDTSRSMTAWSDGTTEVENVERPPYDPEVVYDNSKYGFDANGYYVYDVPSTGWDFENLSNWQVDAIKANEFSIDVLNCSLKSDILTALANYGINNGTYSFFTDGQGWGTGTTNTNTSSILQCQESIGNYNYNGTTYNYMSNNLTYTSTGSAYTNSSTTPEQQCTWTWGWVGPNWWNYGWYQQCNWVPVNGIYNWDNTAYNTIFSGNYLNYLVAPVDGAAAKMMRIDVVQQAAKEVLASTTLTNLNIGLMRFSVNGEGGMVSMPVTPVSEGLSTFNDTIDSFAAYGGTPIEETLYEAFLYMSGGTPKYGTSSKIRDYRNDVQISNEANRDEFEVTNSIVNAEKGYKNTDEDQPSDASATSGGRYIAPGFNGCEPNSKIVLFSDGAPSGDSAGSEIRNLIASTPFPAKNYLSNWCNSSQDDNPGQCAEELAYYMATTDHRPDIPGVQTIQVDTMGGFISNNPGLQQYMEDIADAGNGTFYPVDDYQSMVTNFRSAITEILEKPSTFTSPAISVSAYNSLKISDELYYAVFEPTEDGAWHGNLKRYQISNKGVVDSTGSYAVDPVDGYFLETAKSFWSDSVDGASVTIGGAASKLGDQTRNIYGVIDGAVTALSVESVVNLGDDLLGLDVLEGLSSAVDLTTGLTYKLSLAKWIMGKNDNDTPRLEMEDPIHSRPVVINYGENKRVVFVGTNSGYLHAFDSETGRELFAIIPQELMGNPHFYRSPEYVGNDIKIYGIDGPITYWHDDKNLNGNVDSGEKVILYVGLRRGGHSYYAFDVSDTSNPSLLWQKHGPYQVAYHNKNIPETSAGYERLGQTWSALKPAMITWNGAPKVVLLAGGGYDPDEDGTSTSGPNSRFEHNVGNTIYIIDPENGDVLWDAYSDLASVQADMTSSFVSDISPIDRDGDGLVDLLYAADVGGRLWRFDLNQSSDEFASGGVIADMNDSESSGISANRRFYNNPDVAYIEDAAEPFLLISIGSGYRAHPLSTETSDSIFLIKDIHGIAGAPTTYTKRTKSDLVDWTSSEAENPEKSINGWFLDLNLPGEKVLSTTLTLNGVVAVNTFAPTSDLDPDQCSGNLGQSYSYQLLVAPGLYDKVTKGDDQSPITIPGKTPPPEDPVGRLIGPPEIGGFPEPDTGGRCEEAKAVILSGTTMRKGPLDSCDMIQNSYWEEE